MDERWFFEEFQWLFKNKSNKNIIKIPDTVIIKNSLPCYWFFTSRDGLMKKKN